MAIYAKGSDGIRRLVAGNSDGDMTLMSPRHYVGEATIPTRATDVLAPSWEGKSTVTGTPSPNNPATITGVSFAATAISPDGQTRSVDFGFTGYSLPDGVRDTYDGVRGDFVQRVGKLVLDGTENWLTVSVSEILTIYYIRLYSAKTKHNMISSHFVYNKSNDVCPSFHIDAFNVLIFNYENGVGGVDNFKSWLAAQAAAGTPVTVYYELAQPIAYNRKVDITAFDGRTTVTGADAMDVLEGRVLRVADCLPFEIVRSNRNLALNPYFEINQRGLNTYNTTGYYVDGWHLWSTTNVGTVKPTYPGIDIIADENQQVVIEQKIENIEHFIGYPYTFSILITRITGHFTLQLTTVSEVRITNPGLYYLTAIIPEGSTVQNTMFRLFTLGKTNLHCAGIKLEKGTEQTLARKIGDQWVLNDPPPDPTLELLKCQRYQCVIPFGVGQPISNVIVDGNGSAYFPIYLPVQMRLDIAKIEIQGNLRTHIAGGGYRNCELDGTASLQANICNLRAYGLETNTACGLDSDTGGKIIVDENL